MCQHPQKMLHLINYQFIRVKILFILFFIDLIEMYEIIDLENYSCASCFSWPFFPLCFLFFTRIQFFFVYLIIVIILLLNSDKYMDFTRKCCNFNKKREQMLLGILTKWKFYQYVNYICLIAFRLLFVTFHVFNFFVHQILNANNTNDNVSVHEMR